jgi:hypothetical protein
VIVAGDWVARVAGSPEDAHLPWLLVDSEEDRTLRAARRGWEMIPSCGHGGATLGSLRAADADLPKIIHAADAINHAIPTIDEVEHAIQFLGAAGLVRYSDNSLQLTDEGERVCRRTESHDIFSTLDRLHAFLKKLQEGNGAPDAESVLDRSTYLSARSGTDGDRVHIGSSEGKGDP